MALIITDPQVALMASLETDLQEAYTNGVTSSLAVPVVAPVEQYTNPILTANGGLKQISMKVPFKGLAAAILKAINAGAATGITVAGDGLYLSGGGTTINVGAGNGITANADDIAVNLATSSNLTFVSGGLSVTGVPSLFTINAVATSANVTAANLNTLTGGGSTTLHKHAASGITNTPSGNISSTDVQAALNELQGDIDTINAGGLDARYVNVTGDTMSGSLGVSLDGFYDLGSNSNRWRFGYIQQLLDGNATTRIDIPTTSPTSIAGGWTGGSAVILNRVGANNSGPSAAGSEILAFYPNNFTTKKASVDIYGAYNCFGAFDTQATATAMGLSLTPSVTKNDSNTRTFYGALIKPTLNPGGSNANTTINVVEVDTVNTTTTGLTVNLLRLSYGGTNRLAMTSTGAITLTAGTGTGLTVTGGTNVNDGGGVFNSASNTSGWALVGNGGAGGSPNAPGGGGRFVGGDGASGQGGAGGLQAIGGNGGSSSSGGAGIIVNGGTGGATNGAGGNGITATGGAANGAGTGGDGVNATGGTGNGVGVRGTGVGNGAGVRGQGAGSGQGGIFTGGTTGNGVTANGGATSGNGIVATGTGAGTGAVGTGGATDGNGGSFTGGGNGAGVFGSASGTGWGGQFTNGVRLDGRTLLTSNDGTVMSLDMTQTPGSITKNDANTRQFYGIKFKPILNAGGSNAATTFNLLDLDTTNTATTGITTNLLKISYGGTERLNLASNGEIKVSGSAGSSGQFLTSGGAGAPPTWTAGPPSFLVFSAGYHQYGSFGGGGSGTAEWVLPPGYDAQTVTPRVPRVVIPTAGKLSRLYFRAVENSAAWGVGESIICKVYVNGVATALTATVAHNGSSTASDLSHTVTVAAGDLVHVTVHWGLGTTQHDANEPTATIQFTLT